MATAKLDNDISTFLKTVEDPNLRSEIKTAIIVAGADVATDELAAAAKSKHNKKSKGDMAASISYTEDGKPTTLAYGYAEVYPRGLDYKGDSNTVKAFVLNYGRVSRAPFDGSHWFDNASITAKKTILDAMEEEFGKQTEKLFQY